MKKTRGMPIGILLKSKTVRETLKAKGYDLNQVETGDAQIGRLDEITREIGRR